MVRFLVIALFACFLAYTVYNAVSPVFAAIDGQLIGALNRANELPNGKLTNQH